MCARVCVCPVMCSLTGVARVHLSGYEYFLGFAKMTTNANPKCVRVADTTTTENPTSSPAKDISTPITQKGTPRTVKLANNGLQSCYRKSVRRTSHFLSSAAAAAAAAAVYSIVALYIVFSNAA